MNRLGLATRGNTSLDADSVLHALELGVNYWNWCGHPDGMQQAIRELGSRREDVVVATQFSATTAAHAKSELDATLRALDTDYIDVLTYYYVESLSEWNEIVSSEGAATVLEDARSEGVVRSIGLTTHQRSLVPQIVQSGRIDLLMVRYNAAHRGAEADVFPVTERAGVAVVAFTCLRWGALMRSTPQDPVGYHVPTAPDWYRFVLQNPNVSIALMAPDGHDELLENLTILAEGAEIPADEYEAMCHHGERVYRTAGSFP